MPPQTAQRPGPRIHRLPRRLDYMLVPAPLDLSLDTMTEKSPLPAIIVTPSSPTHSKDFAIAFLAPPKRPSVASRLCNYFSSASDSVATAVTVTKWPGSSLWSRSPIALPISAPATSTEFAFRSNTHTRRNSRILMVLLTVFFLVFCHMVAHFFAYASTTRGTMTSASFQDNNLPDSSSYLNKLELNRWFKWAAKAATPGSRGAEGGGGSD